MNSEVEANKQGESVESNKFQHIGQIREYEEIVNAAEHKCNEINSKIETLKNKLFNNQKNFEKKPSSNSNAESNPYSMKKSGSVKEFVDNIRMREHSVASTPAASNKSVFTGNKAMLVRQISRTIGSERVNPFFGRVNNLLSGLTEPWNTRRQPSNLSDSNKVNATVSQPIQGVENISINKKNRKEPSVRDKVVKRNSKIRLKKQVRVTSSKELVRKSSRASRLGRTVNKTKTLQDSNQPVNKSVRRTLGVPSMMTRNLTRKRNHDLLEIYRNTAVKESNSSESNLAKTARIKLAPIKIDENNHNDVNDENEELVSLVRQSAINKRIFKSDNESQLIGMSDKMSGDQEFKILSTNEFVQSSPASVSLSRNYEQHTISSRMKQANKHFMMQHFNVKPIPFCPVTSLSPSHNVGINLQQMVNMIRNHNPNTKLSPSLVYKLGLVSERLMSKPNDINNGSITSEVTSRMVSQCPLASRCSLNFHQLQEIARGIPQETIEEVDEDGEVTHQYLRTDEECSNVIDTDKIGKLNRFPKQQPPEWSSGDAEEKYKCNCLPQTGKELHQVINKYENVVQKQKTMVNSKSLEFHKDKILLQEKPIKLTSNTRTSVPIQSTIENVKKLPPANQFCVAQRKKALLTENLKKMYEEFKSLTEEHQNLLKIAQDEKEPDEKTLNRIKELDDLMNNKEKDIRMVTDLMTEIQKLKKQLETLEVRASKETVPSKSKELKSEKKNTIDALTSVLNQVKNYQLLYKGK